MLDVEIFLLIIRELCDVWLYAERTLTMLWVKIRGGLALVGGIFPRCLLGAADGWTVPRFAVALSFCMPSVAEGLGRRGDSVKEGGLTSARFSGGSRGGERWAWIAGVVLGLGGGCGATKKEGRAKSPPLFFCKRSLLSRLLQVAGQAEV